MKKITINTITTNANNNSALYYNGNYRSKKIASQRV